MRDSSASIGPPVIGDESSPGPPIGDESSKRRRWLGGEDKPPCEAPGDFLALDRVGVEVALADLVDRLGVCGFVEIVLPGLSGSVPSRLLLPRRFGVDGVVGEDMAQRI